LISTIINGFIAWGVMQCIGEMLLIWPIPGALIVFVKTFIDEELGIAVGITYW
jgi:amino acid transporter